MDNSLQIDVARGLYVDSHAGHMQTLDFATVHANANALAGHLGKPSFGITKDEEGTRAAFEKFGRLCRLAVERFRPGDVWYDPRTPQEVKHGLECARAQRRRVRIFYGDAKSGRDRLAMQDVVGFVGWAGWQLPHPILLAERHQHLGPRICELEVVRILDLDPAGAFSKYQHPRYSLPEFSTVSCSDSAQPDRVTLAADGVPLFECANKAQATRWISFFKGTTHVPPKQPI